MYAIRQIIADPQDAIPVPPELRHRPTEVIFIALDVAETVGETVQTPRESTSADDPIARFCGSGMGGSTARLLAERRVEREREG